MAEFQLMYDLRWVAQAKQGDQQAFTKLYNASYNSVYHLVAPMCKKTDEVDDIIQDTYISCFKNLYRLQDDTRFIPWIKAIARNRALDYLKKKRDVLFCELESDDPDAPELEFEDDRTTYVPDIQTDKRETARLLAEIMQSLPEKQKICVTMFYIENMKVSEIAAELGSSESSVKQALMHGRNNIKEKVLALEKQGTKLYSLAPLPFFYLLIKSWLGTQVLPNAAIGSTAVAAATGSTVAAAGGTTATAAGTAATAATTGTAATTATATTAAATTAATATVATTAAATTAATATVATTAATTAGGILGGSIGLKIAAIVGAVIIGGGGAAVGVTGANYVANNYGEDIRAVVAQYNETDNSDRADADSSVEDEASPDGPVGAGGEGDSGNQETEAGSDQKTTGEISSDQQNTESSDASSKAQEEVEESSALITLLGKVTNLQAESTEEGVALSWEAVNGAEGYLIYAKPASGSYGFKSMTTETIWTDTEASTEEDTSYWVYPYQTGADGSRIPGEALESVTGRKMAAATANSNEQLRNKGYHEIVEAINSYWKSANDPLPAALYDFDGDGIEEIFYYEYEGFSEVEYTDCYTLNVLKWSDDSFKPILRLKNIGLQNHDVAVFTNKGEKTLYILVDYSAAGKAPTEMHRISFDANENNEVVIDTLSSYIHEGPEGRSFSYYYFKDILTNTEYNYRERVTAETGTSYAPSITEDEFQSLYANYPRNPEYILFTRSEFSLHPEGIIFGLLREEISTNVSATKSYEELLSYINEKYPYTE